MKKMLFAVLILPAFSGCMKVREELVLMPDGSGRLTLVFTIETKGDAAKFTGYSERTLANWRVLRQGPKWVKRGGRVFYPFEALKAWVESGGK